MVQLNINFTDPNNPFKFTDPVRKFKENDPYHHEVDNIPIKQLEENVQWLKKSLESATVDIEPTTGGGNNQPVGITEVRRENFSELKPFIRPEIRSNVIYVNPGRFTARINDAYDLTPLQVLTRISASSIAEFDTWDIATQTNPAINTIVNKLRSAISSDSLGLNGLIERNFVSPYTYSKNFIYDITTWTPSLGDGGFVFDDFNLSVVDDYPNFFTFLWGNGQNFGTTRSPILNRELELSSTENHSSPGYVYTLQQAGRDLFFGETEFVKRWRGIARTAVVDIPQELSATISNFEYEDFRFFNEAGTVANSLSTIVSSRVDLLFIYSKPIDQTATHLSIYDGADPVSAYGNSFPDKSPRKIYKAQLGIVKGAGLEMSYKADGQQGLSRWFFANPDGSLQRPEILAQAADQLNTNLGFTSLGVHGSFPSPDDLMNISPLLAEWLPKKHIALVGQTILPIAYIVVKSNSKVNNIQVLSNSDIIDIRPFFRTAELAYNERAGIAAAIPSVSLMNPVATESYVKDELKKLKTLIPVATGGATGTQTTTLLLKDQYNSTDVIARTQDLLQSRNSNPSPVRYDLPFGGKYYALWPSATPSPLVQETPISESDLLTKLFNWQTNATTDILVDGIYKTEFSNDVRWFVFSINRFPAIIGAITGSGFWKVNVGTVVPRSFNIFAQVARGQNGGPLRDSYRPQFINSNWFGSGDNARYRTRGLFEKPNVQFGKYYSSDRFFSTFQAAHWISTRHDDLGQYIQGSGENYYKGINHFYASGNGGLPTTFTDDRFYAGWAVIKDLPPDNTSTNCDFKSMYSAVRPNSNIPLLQNNTTRLENGADFQSLFDYSEKTSSVDIKIVLLVSNRIAVKDIAFTVQNVRTS